MSSLLSELMTSGGWMLHAGQAIHASTFSESLTTAERINRAGWVITQPLPHKAGELQPTTRPASLHNNPSYEPKLEGTVALIDRRARHTGVASALRSDRCAEFVECCRDA